MMLLFSNVDDTEINLDEVREQAVLNMDKNIHLEKARFHNFKSRVTRFNIADYVLLQNEDRNLTKLNPKD